jgi:hypothetical protein
MGNQSSYNLNNIKDDDIKQKQYEEFAMKKIQKSNYKNQIKEEDQIKWAKTITSPERLIKSYLCTSLKETIKFVKL